MNGGEPDSDIAFNVTLEFVDRCTMFSNLSIYRNWMYFTVESDAFAGLCHEDRARVVPDVRL